MRSTHVDWMDASSSVVASDDPISCDLHGEAAILDMRTGTYFGLNAVGARIWDWLQRPITVGELRRNITREFDVEADRAASDLAELLIALDERKLVTAVPNGAG